MLQSKKMMHSMNPQYDICCIEIMNYLKVSLLQLNLEKLQHTYPCLNSLPNSLSVFTSMLWAKYKA